MVVKVGVLNPCGDGAAHKFRAVFCITSCVMENEKQKCESNWKRKTVCLRRPQSNLSDKRPTLHQNSLVFSKKNFHLNKVFIDLFHFQELSISIGIMVNSLLVNVTWNHVANGL